MTRYEKTFRRIARTLAIPDLIDTQEIDLSANALELIDKSKSVRFLDYYGEPGLAVAMHRYGVARMLHARGYQELRLKTRAETDQHHLEVWGRKLDGPEYRLIHLVLRRVPLHSMLLDGEEATSIYRESAKGDGLFLDWVMLQDPISDSKTRWKLGERIASGHASPRLLLPGQDFPGLGMLDRLMEIVFRIAKRLRLACVMLAPQRYHNAVIYEREMKFAEPSPTARLRSLRTFLEATNGLSFDQAAWAMEWGCVKAADGSPLRWNGSLMIRPFRRDLLQATQSESFVRAAAQDWPEWFGFDRNDFESKWQAHLEVVRAK